MGATEKDEEIRAEEAYLEATDETLLAEAILDAEVYDATLDLREAARTEAARLVTWIRQQVKQITRSELGQSSYQTQKGKTGAS